jgi:hypothetical protein
MSACVALQAPRSSHTAHRSHGHVSDWLCMYRNRGHHQTRSSSTPLAASAFGSGGRGQAPGGGPPRRPPATASSTGAAGAAAPAGSRPPPRPASPPRPPPAHARPRAACPCCARHARSAQRHAGRAATGPELSMLRGCPACLLLQGPSAVRACCTPRRTLARGRARWARHPRRPCGVAAALLEGRPAAGRDRHARARACAGRAARRCRPRRTAPRAARAPAEARPAAASAPPRTAPAPRVRVRV